MESTLLEESQENLSTKVTSPVSYKSLGVLIDDKHCDIFISNYRDKVFIIVTQFKKIGALVLVNRDEVKSSSSDPVFHTRSLLGNDSDDIHVFARHLYEHLRINKPAVFGISLKDYSVKTLTLLKEVLLENSLWNC